MTLFSEHLPICKEKKGASAAPSKLFWESVRRRKKFFRSVPSLAPFQSTTEFRSEQNINTTLKQVCVYLIKASLLLYQLFLSYIIPDGEPTASGKQRYIAYEKTPKLPSQITEVIRRIHFYLSKLNIFWILSNVFFFISHIFVFGKVLLFKMYLLNWNVLDTLVWKYIFKVSRISCIEYLQMLWYNQIHLSSLTDTFK